MEAGAAARQMPVMFMLAIKTVRALDALWNKFGCLSVMVAKICSGDDNSLRFTLWKVSPEGVKKEGGGHEVGPKNIYAEMYKHHVDILPPEAKTPLVEIVTYEGSDESDGEGGVVVKTIIDGVDHTVAYNTDGDECFVYCRSAEMVTAWLAEKGFEIPRS